MEKINIILIGPMGSGKTAVGRLLAKLSGRSFYDTDAEIEARTGVDIPFIFEKEGEEGFRRRERNVVAELARHSGIVMATGGGVVVDPENRSALQARGHVVYLSASLETQLERATRSRRRPLLETSDPEARLRELMAIREPLYCAIADYRIATDGEHVTTIAKKLVQHLESIGEL